MNIASHLEAIALYFPDLIALVDDSSQLTYSELNTEAVRIASALTKAGVSSGDFVALLIPNSCTWLSTYLGILKAGAVAVTLPYVMTSKELTSVPDGCSPRLLFTDDAKIPALGTRSKIIHVIDQIHLMHSAILTAGGLVIQAAFDMSALLKAISRLNVIKLYAVPTVYTQFLSFKRLKEKLGPVRYCFSAAASMPRELVKEWKFRTGLDIYETCDMAEITSMVTDNHFQQHMERFTEA